MSVKTGDEVDLGCALPPLSVPVTARHVIMGAAASRDWQPQHHDHRHATERNGLPGIILNTPTQAGWLDRYVTDWGGPGVRFARTRFRMLKPVCPGDEMRLSGTVVWKGRAEQGWWWIQIALSIDRGGELATTAASLIAMPSAAGSNPWKADSENWNPPNWPIPMTGAKP